jgi:hypothetical protein
MDISPGIFLAYSTKQPLVRIRDMSRVHKILYQNFIPAIKQCYQP